MDEWIRFGGAAESNEEKDSRLVKAPKIYNSAKDVPHFCKWGLGLITGGEHISRLVETLIEEVLPTAKLERRRYNGWKRKAAADERRVRRKYQ